jgi:hypothetical protein
MGGQFEANFEQRHYYLRALDGLDVAVEFGEDVVPVRLRPAGAALHPAGKTGEGVKEHRSA